MSNQAPSTAQPDKQDDELALPLPAIICIAIGGYVLLVVIILFIRSMLLQKGICQDQCNCCGKEGEPRCCECWIACVEACNCCKNPNLTACLDSICPRRKQMDCADLILCNVCMDENGQCACCGGPEPMCDMLAKSFAPCWTFQCACLLPGYHICSHLCTGNPQCCPRQCCPSVIHWHPPMRCLHCWYACCPCVCSDHTLRVCCKIIFCVFIWDMLDFKRIFKSDLHPHELAGYHGDRRMALYPGDPRLQSLYPDGQGQYLPYGYGPDREGSVIMAVGYPQRDSRVDLYNTPRKSRPVVNKDGECVSDCLNAQMVGINRASRDGMYPILSTPVYPNAGLHGGPSPHPMPITYPPYRGPAANPSPITHDINRSSSHLNRPSSPAFAHPVVLNQGMVNSRAPTPSPIRPTNNFQASSFGTSRVGCPTERRVSFVNTPGASNVPQQYSPYRGSITNAPRHNMSQFSPSTVYQSYRSPRGSPVPAQNYDQPTVARGYQDFGHGARRETQHTVDYSRTSIIPHGYGYQGFGPQTSNQSMYPGPGPTVYRMYNEDVTRTSNYSMQPAESAGRLPRSAGISGVYKDQEQHVDRPVAPSTPHRDRTRKCSPVDSRVSSIESISPCSNLHQSAVTESPLARGTRRYPRESPASGSFATRPNEELETVTRVQNLDYESPRLARVRQRAREDSIDHRVTLSPHDSREYPAGTRTRTYDRARSRSPPRALRHSRSPSRNNPPEKERDGWAFP